jgi:hypothetical protein
MEKCEACRIEEVTVVETEWDSILPYNLCGQCYSRLKSRSLRPLEYFNLVAIHGHEYELHDDFYDDDGTSSQPDIPVVPNETLHFPTVSELSGNLKRLIDYVLVKWWYPNEVTEHLKAYNGNDVLKELDIRLSTNPALIERLIEIASEVLETEARDWLIYQYKNYDGETPLIFSKALAKCLPITESFKIVKDILSRVKQSELHSKVWALYYFNSTQIIEWIEENKENIKNISNNYGSVCAANQFDWVTAKRWLSMGRPLSLIALDAVFECGTTKNKMNRSPYLRENQPKLLSPESEEIMNKVLDGYLKTDNIHRPRVTIEAIKKDWKDILKLPHH